MGRNLLTAGLMALVCFMLIGCHEHPPEPVISKQASDPLAEQLKTRQQAIREMIARSPCGTLRYSPPLINITGRVSSSPTNGSKVFLYTAHNTTFQGALYVVDHCLPMGEAALDENHEFRFESLPAGKYVVSISPNSFPQGCHGFPVVIRINQSNLTVNVSFHGGDMRHSLVAFTIQPMPTDKR